MLLQEHPPSLVAVRTDPGSRGSFQQEGDPQEPVFKNAMLRPILRREFYTGATHCSLLTVSLPVQPDLAPGPRTELGPAQTGSEGPRTRAAVTLAAAGGVMEAGGRGRGVAKVTECGSKMPFHVKAPLPCL